MDQIDLLDPLRIEITEPGEIKPDGEVCASNYLSGEDVTQYFRQNPGTTTTIYHCDVCSRVFTSQSLGSHHKWLGSARSASAAKGLQVYQDERNAVLPYFGGMKTAYVYGHLCGLLKRSQSRIPTNWEIANAIRTIDISEVMRQMNAFLAGNLRNTQMFSRYVLGIPFKEFKNLLAQAPLPEEQEDCIALRLPYLRMFFCLVKMKELTAETEEQHFWELHDEEPNLRLVGASDL